MERYITCIFRDGEIEQLKLYVADIVSKNDFIPELKKEIVKVIIPEGVTNIEVSAFENFGNLKIIILPKSVRWIKERAFYELQKLEYINLYKEIKLIGRYAFYGCKSLKRVVLFNSTNVLEKAFAHTGIEELIILKQIHNFIPLYNFSYHHFFENCYNLKKLYFLQVLTPLVGKIIFMAIATEK